MNGIVVVCCGKAGSEKAGHFPARIRDTETGKYNKKYARMKEGQQQPQADATATVQPVEQKRAFGGILRFRSEKENNHANI